jgi:hypothetical protein
MKIYILPMMLIAGLTIGSVNRSNAQTRSKGLYLTYNDYTSHKLSYTEDPSNSNGNKIALHDFFGSKQITVISNGKKLTFDKDQIFGYRDANGNDYRFHDGKAYQIVDTNGFYIYSHDSLVQQGKGPKPTPGYYFSKTSNSALLPLTFQNIISAFPENPKFRYMAEVASAYNVKADAFDSNTNAYKIKELYLNSLK